MARVLIVDRDQGHAERVRGLLRFHDLDAEVCCDPQRAISRLRRLDAAYDVVIVNISDVSLPWFGTLAKLQEASIQSGVYPSPLFLCVSTVKQSPQFELRVERMGARYVFEH